MQRRRIISLLFLFIILAFTSGCWDRQELEDSGFILAIGLDAAPGEKVSVSTQIAVPANLAPAGGGGGGQGPPVLVETLEGRTLSQALRLLHTSADRRLNYAHNKVIIIGEELAEKGISKELDVFTRYREMRRNVLIMVAKGKAQDILKVLPEQERNPSEYLENLNQLANLTSVAPQVNLHQFILEYGMPGISPIAPLVKKPREEEQNNEFNQGSGQSDGKGQMEQATKLNLAGTAIFQNDKKVGELNMTETQGLLFLRGEVEQALINIDDPKVEGEKIALAVNNVGRRVQIRFARNKVIFDIDLTVEADIRQFESNVNYVSPSGLRKLQRALSKKIEQQAKLAIQKCQEEYKVDCIGLGEQVRQTMSYKEWSQYNWQEKFPEAQINVHVRSYLRRVGMTFRPLAPR